MYIMTRAESIVASLLESPMISKRGSDVYADEDRLKEVPLSKVEDNLVFIRQPTDGIMAKGWTVVYFMDTEESAQQMAAGDLPYLVFPVGTFRSGGSPITDVWKKRFQQPGTEHILGLIQGHTDEGSIYVDMISVRPGYRRNTIASKMMDLMRQVYPQAKLTHSSTTKDGGKLMKAYGHVDPSQKP